MLRLLPDCSALAYVRKDTGAVRRFPPSSSGGNQPPATSYNIDVVREDKCLSISAKKPAASAGMVKGAEPKEAAAPVLTVCCTNMAKNDQGDDAALTAAGASELCALASAGASGGVEQSTDAKEKKLSAAEKTALQKKKMDDFAKRLLAVLEGYLLKSGNPSADARLKCAGLKLASAGSSNGQELLLSS